MDAYSGVLHEEEPLNLYDPSLTSTLSSENSAKPADIDCLKPTSVKVARELDPRTKKVRNMLKEAMHTRLYMHYYPTQAYKRKNFSAARKQDYHFSYLLDMQALFHPALSNGKLLRKIIMSFSNTTQEEKELHSETLTKYLW
jgi:hypothetical protein